MTTEPVSISRHDELLIQRCLDNELSSDDKKAFLNRLDHLRDGWKTLACGFLSERSFSQTVKAYATPTSTVPNDETPETHGGTSHLPGTNSRVKPLGGRDATASSVSLAGRMPRWWSHPLTSLALCAAIAFVAGTLVPDQQIFSSSRVPTAPPVPGNLPQISGFAVKTGPSEYSVDRLPDGSLLNQPVRIPVTRSPQELGRFLQQNPDLRRQLEAGTIRMMRVSADENQDILFFVNENDRPIPFQ